MICKQCSTEYESKRKDSQFCSPLCRKRNSRVTDNLVTDNVTDNRTDNSVVPKLVPTGRADYTREMVEADTDRPFTPNWYTLGFESRDEAKGALGWGAL